MLQSEPNFKKTRAIKNPHYYVSALTGEYAHLAYDEERARALRGKWRQSIGVGEDHPMDLEIGTGNGYFFAHQVTRAPERFLLGLEIKFKPLIQSVRRASLNGSHNFRGIRYDGRFADLLFAPNELNNVFIHHPDPWERPKKFKHRLLSKEFLTKLYALQIEGSFVDIKTDSKNYFDWALQQIAQSAYQVERLTYDLHQSEWAQENFITYFESLFLKKSQPIYYLRLKKIIADN
jgi:tRNA (guanine-N7-)-methyltransferase